MGLHIKLRVDDPRYATEPNVSQFSLYGIQTWSFTHRNLKHNDVYLHSEYNPIKVDIAVVVIPFQRRQVNSCQMILDFELLNHLGCFNSMPYFFLLVTNQIYFWWNTFLYTRFACKR